jgi:hypothetical protein
VAVHGSSGPSLFGSRWKLDAKRTVVSYHDPDAASEARPHVLRSHNYCAGQKKQSAAIQDRTSGYRLVIRIKLYTGDREKQ